MRKPRYELEPEVGRVGWRIWDSKQGRYVARDLYPEAKAARELGRLNSQDQGE